MNKIKFVPIDHLQWKALTTLARPIVFVGSEAKYSQNEDLLDALLATKGYVLVEASPYDKVWGIQMSEFVEDAFNPAKWKGTNWLGETLTKLRSTYTVGRKNIPQL